VCLSEYNLGEIMLKDIIDYVINIH